MGQPMCPNSTFGVDRNMEPRSKIRRPGQYDARIINAQSQGLSAQSIYSRKSKQAPSVHYVFQ